MPPTARRGRKCLPVPGSVEALDSSQSPGETSQCEALARHEAVLLLQAARQLLEDEDSRFGCEGPSAALGVRSCRRLWQAWADGSEPKGGGILAKQVCSFQAPTIFAAGPGEPSLLGVEWEDVGDVGALLAGRSWRAGGRPGWSRQGTWRASWCPCVMCLTLFWRVSRAWTSMRTCCTTRPRLCSTGCGPSASFCHLCSLRRSFLQAAALGAVIHELWQCAREAWACSDHPMASGGHVILLD